MSLHVGQQLRSEHADKQVRNTKTVLELEVLARIRKRMRALLLRLPEAGGERTAPECFHAPREQVGRRITSRASQTRHKASGDKHGHERLSHRRRQEHWRQYPRHRNTFDQSLHRPDRVVPHGALLGAPVEQRAAASCIRKHALDAFEGLREALHEPATNLCEIARPLTALCAEPVGIEGCQSRIEDARSVPLRQQRLGNRSPQQITRALLFHEGIKLSCEAAIIGKCFLHLGYRVLANTLSLSIEDALYRRECLRSRHTGCVGAQQRRVTIERRPDDHATLLRGRSRVAALVQIAWSFRQRRQLSSKGRRPRADALPARFRIAAAPERRHQLQLGIVAPCCFERFKPREDARFYGHTQCLLEIRAHAIAQVVQSLRIERIESVHVEHGDHPLAGA